MLSLVIVMLVAPTPAGASHCRTLAEDVNRSHKRSVADDLHECIVEDVAEADTPFAWVPIALGAFVIGVAAAVFLLRRATEPERQPRSEDEAWAELLGSNEV